MNLGDLENFEENKVIDREALHAAGLIKKSTGEVKLLGGGEISSPVVIRVDKVSRSARQKIEAAGGKVEIV